MVSPDPETLLIASIDCEIIEKTISRIANSEGDYNIEVKKLLIYSYNGFFEKKIPLHEIAEEVGISRSRIAQIRDRLVKRLRKELAQKDIYDFECMRIGDVSASDFSDVAILNHEEDACD